MSEPKRWLDDDPPELVGQLLKAASRERPPEASLSRSLAALGISAGATSTAATAGAAGMASAVKATSAAVPWLKFAVVLGVAGGTGGAWVATHPTPTPAPLSARSAQPLPRAQPAMTAQLSQPPVVELVPAPSSAPPIPSPSLKSAPAPVTRVRETDSSTPAVDAEHLTEEVTAVDQARALVAAGRGAEALAALDAYERRFPVRRFAPEALYLRMEALLLDGNRSAAEQAAARLIARYPKSPQAPRARQILGTTNP